MYSAKGCPDMTPGGLPHSDILGSKPVRRLPEAYRSLPRPSSPPGAKASTNCPYYLNFRRLAPTPMCLSKNGLLSKRKQNPALVEGPSSFCKLGSKKPYPGCSLQNSQKLIKNSQALRMKSLQFLLGFCQAKMVEVNGIEPMTSCVQGRRSPS